MLIVVMVGIVSPWKPTFILTTVTHCSRSLKLLIPASAFVIFLSNDIRQRRHVVKVEGVLPRRNCILHKRSLSAAEAIYK